MLACANTLRGPRQCAWDSGIEKIATSNEIHRAIAHMFRQFDLIKYAVQKGEIELTRTLSEQLEKQGVLLEELKVELATVHNQTTQILDNVQYIVETQNEQLESIQRKWPKRDAKGEDDV